METGKKIYPAMVAIMSSITALEKSRQNQAQGYRFRGIDDVYNMLHEIMADNGVFCLPNVVADRHEERTNQKGTVLIYRIVTMRYTFMASDGSSVEATAIGEGMDSGDKAANKAMSAAQKYALLQAFLIPTEEATDKTITAATPTTIGRRNQESEIHRRGEHACEQASTGRSRRTGRRAEALQRAEPRSDQASRPCDVV
jgi:hypothetical protein